MYSWQYWFISLKCSYDGTDDVDSLFNKIVSHTTEIRQLKDI